MNLKLIVSEYFSLPFCFVIVSYIIFYCWTALNLIARCNTNATMLVAKNQACFLFFYFLFISYYRCQLISLDVHCAMLLSTAKTAMTADELIFNFTLSFSNLYVFQL